MIPPKPKSKMYGILDDGYVADDHLQSISSIDPTVASNHKRKEDNEKSTYNNMRVMASATPSSVDERIAREARPGEIRFKQIKLIDKRNKNEVILLVRKI